jgi:purine-binding chemotaxis protein CheW
MRQEELDVARRVPEPGQPTGAESSRNVLVFVLGTDRYALPCERVVEIIAAVAIQRLPKAPPIVEGAINVRGTIVPVLAIATRFGATQKPVHPDQHFILARTGNLIVALRVDRAEEVLSVGADTIRKASSIPGTEYMEGIAPVDRGVIVIHDLDALLARDESALLTAALAT